MTSYIETVYVTETKYAIKYYTNQCRALTIEHYVMSQLKHPNLMSMICTTTKKVQNNIHIGMMMSFEVENLSDYLERMGHGLPLKKKFNHLIQIARGLEYLHQNQILHLDLKLDNIMITGSHLKIIDFGSAEKINGGSHIFVSEIKCTSTHRPPEGFGYELEDDLFIKIDYGFDVWSFGIIMYEILSGIPLYLQKFFPVYTKEIYPDMKSNNVYDLLVYHCITNPEFIVRMRYVLKPRYMKCLNLRSSARPLVSDILRDLVEEI